MSFTDQLTSDFAAFINTDEFAEAISYKCYGVDAVTVDAVVVREDYIKAPGEENYLTKSANLYVLASDLAAAPNVDGDIATFDGVAWETDAWKPIGGTVGYKIHVTRKELLSVEA